MAFPTPETGLETRSSARSGSGGGKGPAAEGLRAFVEGPWRVVGINKKFDARLSVCRRALPSCSVFTQTASV